MSARGRLLMVWLVTCVLCAIVPTNVNAASERADQLAERPDAEALARVATEYGPAFRIYETAHFRVISNTSDRHHRVVSGLLELFYEEVHTRFFERSSEPLTVILISSEAEFEPFVAGRGFRNFSGDALYDEATRSLYARRFAGEGREAGLSAVFREVGIAMIGTEFRGRSEPPFWFAESFASLFEEGRVVHGEWIYGNSSPERATLLRASLADRAIPPLAEFFEATATDLEAADVDPNRYTTFGRSWLLYLLLEHGEKPLRAFVAHLAAGTPAKEVAEAVTGLKLPAIERGWHESIRAADLVGDYMNRGTGPTAETVLRLGAELYPRHGNLHIMLAAEYLKLNKPRDAVEHAQIALKDPRFIYPERAHSIIGRAALSRDPHAAVRSLERSLTYQPWIETVMKLEYETLARVLRNAGSEERADEILEELKNLLASDTRE